MRFSEAFSRLGYQLSSPRTDWSAESATGICISLWRSEIDWKSFRMDTRVNAGPPETWNAAGNNKRIRHLATAILEFDGWVDVVIVDGTPGEGVKKANPWVTAERKGLRWHVSEFEPNVGHFLARAIYPTE